MKFPWSKRSAVNDVPGRQLRAPMERLTPNHPAVRATRELARMSEVTERLNRAYDAAMTDNYNADFKGTYGSPNSEISISQYQTLARTRTLAKDTPHGKTVVRTFQNNVVGHDPFKLEMKIGSEVNGKFVEDKKKNQLIERGWKRFCKQENFTVRKTMSFMQSARMVESELITAGSVMCRIHRDYPYNEFGFAVDFLELDRLQTSYQGKDSEGNPIRFSISWHKDYNFPIYYHVLARHPGEYFAYNAFASGKYGASADPNYRIKVPANDIIFVNNLRDRAEQDIGMTELDSTVMPLWRIHQYEKALTLSAIASAAKPFWLERKMPTGMTVPDAMREQWINTQEGTVVDESVTGGNNPTQSEEGATSPTSSVMPAARETLPAGFELKQADPKFPIDAAHEFRQDNLRDIAVGTGVSYQHTSGDFQNLGFIAGLMCQIPFQEHCKVRQHNLKETWIERLFREWLIAAIKSGWFDEKGDGVEVLMSEVDDYCESAHFKARGWQFVNPLVQAQAIVLMVDRKHITRQQAQNMLPDGLSFEKLVAELKNEQDELEANGIDVADGADDKLDEDEIPGDEDDPPGDKPTKKKPQLPRAKKKKGK